MNSYQLISRIGDNADLYLWTPEAVPSVGYRTYYIAADRPADGGSLTDNGLAIKRLEVSADDRTMENEYLWVKINDDGSLDLREKVHDSTYRNLAYFEDGGDCGDTYDYSYPPEDLVVTSLDDRQPARKKPSKRRARITLETAGPLVARFRVEIALKCQAG